VWHSHEIGKANKNVSGMCTRDTLGKKLCDMLPIGNGLEQRNAPLPLLFNFASEYAIRRDQIMEDGFK
jgi:hypothetical protein